MREVIATGKTVEEATENGCLELGLSRDEVSVEILEFPAKKLFKTTPAKVRVSADAEEAAAPAGARAEAGAPVKPAPAPAAPAPAAAAPARPAQAQVQAQMQAPGQAAHKEKAGGKVLPAEPEIAIDIEATPSVKRACDYLNSIFGAMGVPTLHIEAFRQGDATLLRVEGEAIADKIEVRGEVVQALSYLIDRSVNAGVDKKDDEYLRVRLDVAGYRNRRESELIALATRTGKEVARSGRSRTLAPMNPYERLIVHTAISAMEGITSESIGADTERRVVVKSLAPNATEGEDWHPPKSGRPHGDRDRDRDGRGGGHGGDRRGDRRPAAGGRGGERGGDRGRGGRGPGGPGGPRSSTPEREYAESGPRDPGAKPVVPRQREAIKDGEDLPLYGKIEL